MSESDKHWDFYQATVGKTIQLHRLMNQWTSGIGINSFEMPLSKELYEVNNIDLKSGIISATEEKSRIKVGIRFFDGLECNFNGYWKIVEGKKKTHLPSFL